MIKLIRVSVILELGLYLILSINKLIYIIIVDIIVDFIDIKYIIN